MRNQKRKSFRNWKTSVAVIFFLLVVTFIEPHMKVDEGSWWQSSFGNRPVADVQDEFEVATETEDVFQTVLYTEQTIDDKILLRANEAGTVALPEQNDLMDSVLSDLTLYPSDPIPSMFIEMADSFQNQSIYTADAFLTPLTLSSVLLQVDASLSADSTLQDDISKKISYTPIPGRTVYFTIDDGPSKLTNRFLDIFDQHDVRATFFLIGRNVSTFPEQTKEIYDRGHFIANHSYSHDYTRLYASRESLKRELGQWDSAVSKALGFPYHTNIFRFPGGSSYSTAKQYRDYVRSEGYQYYDWNCLNGDAQIRDKSANSLFNYMVSTYKGQDEVILLIHDTAGKETTVDMLEQAILFFKERGYAFKTMDEK